MGLVRMILKILKLVVIVNVEIVHGTLLDDDVLRGAHFMVYALQYPPFMSMIKDPNSRNKTSYQGLSVSFVNYIVQDSNLSLEYVMENATEVAKIGQMNAAYKSVENKMVDFSSLPMALGVTNSNESVVGFTTIAFQETFQFLGPWPKEESRLTAVIRPYNFEAWITIIISTLIFALFITTLGVVYRYCFRSKILQDSSSFSHSLSDTLIYIMSILFQQGNRLEANKLARLSFRLVVGLWLLMTVVLVNLYTSTITSYLTVVKLEPIANTPEELVNLFEHRRGKCMITMQKGHPLMEVLRNMEYLPYKKMTEWYDKHPEFFTKAYNEVTENIVNKSCIHIGTLISSKFRINADYKKYGKCRMALARPLDFGWISAFLLPKDNRFTSVVNFSIIKAMEAGLIEYWKRWSNGVSLTDMCKISGRDNKENRNEKQKPIKLIELTSAFFVLGIGYVLTTTAFLLEKIIHTSLVHFGTKKN